MAPGMKDCYVWLDFGCINQDGNPAGELEQLDKIVQCCDCIFTPIVDHDEANTTTGYATYQDYQAKLWNEGPHAYLNRGWCRVEMMYASNIPVLANSDGTKRHEKFSAALAFHCSHNRRPHFIYGTKELNDFRAVPLVLPPLQHTYFEKYHPLKGSLSVPEDIEHIQTLITELQPYLDTVKFSEGYEGGTNAANRRHGHGIYRCKDGSIYEGEFENGVFIYGSYRTASGSEYVGEWNNGIMEGYGTYRYAIGEVYEGQHKDGKMHGHGTYYCIDGSVYSGQYDMNEVEGYGKWVYAGGAYYDGEWRKEKRHGHGKFQCTPQTEANKGEFLDTRVLDHGSYRFCYGDSYKGQWDNGKLHGRGTFRYASGDVYDGIWQNDKKHGYGKLTTAFGEVIEGQWNEDQRVPAINS